MNVSDVNIERCFSILHRCNDVCVCPMKKKASCRDDRQLEYSEAMKVACRCAR